MRAHAKKDVIISVNEEHLGKIRDVASRLQRVGLNIESVLEATGTITGSVPADRVTALSGVAGVAAVEPARSYQLNPPDSDVQ